MVDADALVPDAEAPGGDVLAQITQRFGADGLAPDGSLDHAVALAAAAGLSRIVNGTSSRAHGTHTSAREC